MLIREAEAIAGRLARTSKMPSRSTSTPATACNVGQKLAKVKGSTCEGCYALKGNYTFKNVQEALQQRLEAIKHPQWVEAMTVLILKQSKDYFRWHDSGDIQDAEHLEKILQVCRNTPDTLHWIPTREYKLMLRLDADSIPDNVVFRISAPMIDGPPPRINGLGTSTVHKDAEPQGQVCPAPTQEGQCKDCRACWDKRVENISYHVH